MFTASPPKKSLWLMLSFAFCYQIWFGPTWITLRYVDIETFQFLKLSQITLLQLDKTVWTKSLSHDYQWRKWRSFSSNSIWTWKSVFWRSSFFCQKNWKLTSWYNFSFLWKERNETMNHFCQINKRKKLETLKKNFRLLNYKINWNQFFVSQKTVNLSSQQI